MLPTNRQVTEHIARLSLYNYLTSNLDGWLQMLTKRTATSYVLTSLNRWKNPHTRFLASAMFPPPNDYRGMWYNGQFVRAEWLEQGGRLARA